MQVNVWEPLNSEESSSRDLVCGRQDELCSRVSCFTFTSSQTHWKLESPFYRLTPEVYILASMCLAELLTPSKHPHKMGSLSKYGMLFQDSKEKEKLAKGQCFQKGRWGSSSEPFVCSSQGFPTTCGEKGQAPSLLCFSYPLLRLIKLC